MGKKIIRRFSGVCVCGGGGIMASKETWGARGCKEPPVSKEKMKEAGDIKGRGAREAQGGQQARGGRQ